MKPIRKNALNAASRSASSTESAISACVNVIRECEDSVDEKANEQRD
jgi:hypothetical protein